MRQRIVLSEGVVKFGVNHPSVSTTAKKTPAVRLSRLQQLIKTKKPSICIVRGEGIGDVLMTTPTVHAIKELFQDCDITFATNTSYLDRALVKILYYNPDINTILERNLVDDSAYDLVINLHCPAIALEKMGQKPPSRIDIFAKHAGVKLDNSLPRYYIQPEETERGEMVLGSVPPDAKVILVQPFASGGGRNTDQTKLKSAVMRLNAQYGVKSVIITHDGDIKSDVLWNNLPGTMLLHNEDVRGIAAVMVHCDLVLCQDSSILHLAAALDVPTVGLFGPTYPASVYSHYKKAVALWKGNDVPACPCWYQMCPTGYACMARVTPDDIVQTCLKHMAETKKTDITKLLGKALPMTINTELV